MDKDLYKRKIKIKGKGIVLGCKDTHLKEETVEVNNKSLFVFRLKASGYEITEDEVLRIHEDIGNRLTHLKLDNPYFLLTSDIDLEVIPMEENKKDNEFIELTWHDNANAPILIKPASINVMSEDEVFEDNEFKKVTRLLFGTGSIVVNESISDILALINKK